LLQNHFFKNSLDEKNFSRIFLLLQNHCLGKILDEMKLLDEIFFVAKSYLVSFWMELFLRKLILVEKFFGGIFFCCKIISSETVWMKKIFGRNFLGRKFFIVPKSFL